MATVNLKRFPLTLRAINSMLHEQSGINHKRIFALEVPAKYEKRLAKAEAAARLLKGKRVSHFLKTLPDYIPASEMQCDALEFFATADYDTLVQLARKVKGGSTLHRVLDDAFDGEDGSIAEAIYAAQSKR